MRELVIVVVAAARRGKANTDAGEFDRGKPARTFTQALSASGQAPATHYWCSVWLTRPQRERFEEHLAAMSPRGRTFNGELKTPAEILAALGLKPIEGR